MVDTPGFDDPSGNDTAHIRNMVTVLKTIGHVDILMIVLNGQTPRLDRSNIAMLLVFKAMFGDQFLKNTVLEFTRWGYDDKSVKRRERSKVSEQHWLQQINTRLEDLKLKPADSKSVPGVFIDALHDTETEHEARMFRNERDKLLVHLEEAVSLKCTDFHAVPVEIDRIKAQVEELERQIELEKEQARLAEEQARLAEEGAREEEERRRIEEEARRVAEEQAHQAQVRAGQAEAARIRAQQQAEAQRIAAEQRAAAARVAEAARRQQVQLAHEQALRDAIPQYGPWEQRQYINTGTWFHNEKMNWGFAIKWKRKRWGWHVTPFHSCSGEEVQADSPLSPAQIIAEARAHIALVNNVGLDQIREDVLFPTRGVGGINPVNCRWRVVWDQYVLTYYFRAKNR